MPPLQGRKFAEQYDQQGILYLITNIDQYTNNWTIKLDLGDEAL